MRMYKTAIDGKGGFTLVELMITLAISSLIVAALYATYILQQRSYTNQGNVTEMQQNVRVGLDFLIIDLRMAGYDPLDTNAVGNGITAATANSITFTADMDKNGVIGTAATPAAENEHFSYDLTVVNGIPTLRRSAGTTPAVNLQPMADYIEQIEFYYFYENGTAPTTAPLGATLNNIRSVQVTMLARSADPDRQYTNETLYTTASGVVWSAENDTWPDAEDNYRRRLLTTRIDLRNMGL